MPDHPGLTDEFWHFEGHRPENDILIRGLIAGQSDRDDHDQIRCGYNRRARNNLIDRDPDPYCTTP